MAVLALALLLLAGLSGLPQNRRTARGPGGRFLLATALGQVLLLAGAAAAALAAAEVVPTALAAPIAVVAAAAGGGPVTVAIIRMSYRREAVTTTQAAQAEGQGELVLRGGLWIGILERTAIAATLWAGWPEGLAVVLAVKGLGRYSELGKDGAAERFILGTFASVMWACACTGIGCLLVHGGAA
ncbi:hypothetical protein ACQ3I4_02720 [Zafaria sp. Z1313]|uniref:hypothetical protein n=1 Tax=unclassified Zafaria TaxID=2828765 RepID=UPI002E76C6DE|nr:hypothetical protein [Zafaria sp. J156]MEE1621184.1 hypothetical protein [Zafaria sp. J156]